MPRRLTKEPLSTVPTPPAQRSEIARETVCLRPPLEEGQLTWVACHLECIVCFPLLLLRDVWHVHLLVCLPDKWASVKAAHPHPDFLALRGEQARHLVGIGEAGSGERGEQAQRPAQGDHPFRMKLHRHP